MGVFFRLKAMVSKYQLEMFCASRTLSTLPQTNMVTWMAWPLGGPFSSTDLVLLRVHVNLQEGSIVHFSQ